MFNQLETLSIGQKAQDCLLVIEKIKAEFSAIETCTLKMTEDKIINDSSTNVKELSINELIEILHQVAQYAKNNEFNEELLTSLQGYAAQRPTEINNIINACNDFEFERATHFINELTLVLTSTNKRNELSE
jgi:hypothetical protein